MGEEAAKDVDFEKEAEMVRSRDFSLLARGGRRRGCESQSPVGQCLLSI